MKHFLTYFDKAVHENWDAPALCNFRGETFTFGETATEIEKIHLVFEAAGIKPGDHIALCAKNSARWAIAFFASVTYKAVVVPILNDFTPDTVEQLTAHSESVVLFTEPAIWEKMNAANMPQLRTAVDVNTFRLLYSSEQQITDAVANIAQQFIAAHPNGITPKDINYKSVELDRLTVIDYTSGTMSSPKGVMLTARNISSNTEFGMRGIPASAGETVLSMLPLAHLYGMAFELIYPLCMGCSVHFLGKTPTPTILLEAFAEVKPYIIIAVPLVIEKIFKGKVIPVMQKPAMRVALAIPGLRQIICKKVRKSVISALGGHVRDVVIGGAAIARNVENVMRMIKFPYTVGYGMTECAPLIGYEDWKKFAKRSCGKVVTGMKVRIDSENERKIVGEIQVKGDNVTIGYFKNPEATTAAFTDDGWFRTGDLGLVDRHGNIFIKGRSKAMILGANGQNIYPEEIEDKLNTLPLVLESLVVERDKKLVALVAPDTAGKPADEGFFKRVAEEMKANLAAINKQLPQYCKISAIELIKGEFAKTPKRSIKRFLYK